MRLGNIGVLVAGGLLVLGCAASKDSEHRLWTETELLPYLNKMADQLCIVKDAAAPAAEEVPGLCDGADPEGYTPPKPDGKP